MSRLVLSIRLSWWLRAYLRSVALMSILTGCEPDSDKVGKWIERGVRVKAVKS